MREHPVIKMAMKLAKAGRIDKGASWYAHIPGFNGLWATGWTKKDALADLESALPGWLYYEMAQVLKADIDRAAKAVPPHAIDTV